MHIAVAVLVALLIARLHEVATGGVPQGRLLITPGNAWFAIGPVAVFEAANVQPMHAGAGVLLAALAAEFAVDFGVSAIRFAITRGARIIGHAAAS